jgi:antitoxin VapB
MADEITDLRAPLTQAELNTIKTLGKECSYIMQRFCKRIKRGWSEYRISGMLTGELLASGITPFVMLVGSDERIRQYRHPLPTDKTIDKLVMIALCAQRHGLIVCLTRLVHFGKMPVDLRRRHNAVCHVDATLERSTIPGVRWCDLFKKGQKTYSQHGFPGEWKLHHQGGPMGYECRDFKATPFETRRVKEAQPVGWNPSITGTKSEDTVISGNPPEIITESSDWPMIDVNGWPRPDILERRNI